MSSSPTDCHSSSQALSSQLSELLAALSCFSPSDYTDQMHKHYFDSYRNRQLSLQEAIAKVVAMHPACDRAAATVEQTSSSAVFYVVTQPLASAQLRDEIQRCIDSWGSGQTEGQEGLEALIVQDLYNLGLANLRELSEGLDSTDEDLARGLRPYVEAVVRILQEMESDPPEIQKLHRILYNMPYKLRRNVGVLSRPRYLRISL